MTESITCDFCHKPIVKDRLVKVEATTFGPDKPPQGVAVTLWAVSVAVERFDFHEACWPLAKAKLSGS